MKPRVIRFFLQLLLIGFFSTFGTAFLRPISNGFTSVVSQRLHSKEFSHDTVFRKTRLSRRSSLLWSSTATAKEDISAAETTTLLELDPHQVLSDDTCKAIQHLFDQRGKARREGHYDQADQLRVQLMAVSLPEGVTLSLQDNSHAKGGGSTWKLHYKVAANKNALSILHLAHAALGLSISCSQRALLQSEKQQQLESLVEEAKSILSQWKVVQDQILRAQASGRHASTKNPVVHSLFQHENTHSDISRWAAVEMTLRGRKSADAAFWFALAGAADTQLFDLLAHVCIKELQRFGIKSTCSAKHIYQIMDRFAAAGLSSSSISVKLETVARDLLQTKQTLEDFPRQEQRLLDLHSDRSLLLQWKFFSRQKKLQLSARKHWEGHRQQQQRIEQVGCDAAATSPVSERTHRTALEKTSSVDWEIRFKDSTRPLVIDIGCGMGQSLLGLASLGDAAASQDVESGTKGKLYEEDIDAPNDVQINYQDCNYLGVDLSDLAVGYAQGISERLGLSDRIQWEVDAAEAILQRVIEYYPGTVSLCLIQFPTPYRLAAKNGEGNSQLPSSALEGFMVSPNLLQLIHKVLSKPSKANHDAPRQLILQSNCEDVALWMHDTAVSQACFEAVPMSCPTEKAMDTDADLPQRTLNWIEMGGARAVGPSWSAVPLLPRVASTETEVACRIDCTPVHRCVLVPKSEP